MMLELTVKATLILLLVSMGSLALRRSSAASRHLFQVLGLVAVLALPLGALALPSWSLPIVSAAANEPADSLDPIDVANVASVGSNETRRTREKTAARALPAFESASAIRLSPAATMPVIETPSKSAPTDSLPGEISRESCDCAATPLAGSGVGRDETRIAGITGPVDPGFGVSDALRALWLLGIALVLVRLAAGWLEMTRAAIEARPIASARLLGLIDDCCETLGVRAAPRSLLSRTMHVPTLWGFVRPTLILPTAALTWSDERLRVVLLHELSHLRRLDGLALLAGRIAAALWWFNPLVWLVERGARRDCERACDDAVLAAGQRPSTYARHLLEIAGEMPVRPRATQGALALVGPGELESRLRSILRPGARRELRRGSAAALCLVMTVGLASVASARAVARDATAFDETGVEQAVESFEAYDPPEAREVFQADLRRDESDDSGIMFAHDGHDREDGAEAFERAYDFHREEAWTEAAELFEEAASLGYRPGTSLYNAACGQARLGRVDQAIGLIEQALDAGFDSYGLLHEDADLDPIRSDPAFRAMLEGLAEQGRLRRAPRFDRFDQAVEAYDDLLAEGSTEGQEWYRVGSTLLSLRDFERATDALGRAAGLLESSNYNALYNLSCAYALQGDSAAALDHLEQAVYAGFDSEERFRNDSDLDTIRPESRFEELRDLADFLSLDRFRRFDFRGTDYSERRWTPAVEEFSSFVADNPGVGRAWFNLGWALHYSHRHAEARDAFTRQLDLGFRPGNAEYNIACTYAMEGNSDQAFDWLDRAVNGEHVSAHQLLSDEDLGNLHDDPRFEALVERAADLHDEGHSMHRFGVELKDHQRSLRGENAGTL